MKIISRGIDVSKWQGDFDFAQAKKEGFDFAIIKGGGADGGLYKDGHFESHYAKARALGMHVGAYWYSRALSAEDAVKEADHFYMTVLKGKQFDLPVYIDVEEKAQLNLGKRALTDIIKAWCDRLESLGYWVGIYSSCSFFSAHMYDQELTRYAHWVAQWDTACTYPYEGCLGVWQYGGSKNLIRSNIVAGVVCDQNYLYVDYPARIKAAGLNGYAKEYSKPKEEAAAKTVTVGATVRLKKGARDYDGRALAAFVYERDHVVKKIEGNRAVITYGGVTVAAVKVVDLEVR